MVLSIENKVIEDKRKYFSYDKSNFRDGGLLNVSINKSPAELLTGIKHIHWLEILGYTRFKRAQAIA